MLSLIVGPTSFAHELVVIDGRLKYQLMTSAKSIAYNETETSLSFILKKCNAHILKRFNAKLDRLLINPFLVDGRKNYIEIKLDKKIGFEPRFGERAVFLLAMNEEIKKLKIEESFNCQK